LHAPHDPPIPEAILRKILFDALAGLEYLHSLRIAHRDIKPDNLLLASDGTVKLADLGVARQFGSQESEFISETHGTYHFFSPEMCSGEARYSAFISDIWSLGVTLFILATGGRVPFLSAQDNPQELFNQISAHRRGGAEYPSDCTASASLRDLVDSIMEPDPRKRLSIAQIRAHQWMTQAGTAQGGEPPSPLVHDMQNLALTSPILVPATE
jgi:[calcium/calmodulin-dependent protein kinase] kinase